MIETKGNLWDYYHMRDHGFISCITTNGTVKKNGCAVMGRGCAAQAKHLIPGIDRAIGRDIVAHGLRCFYVTPGIVAFPVKFQWFQRADLRLIEDSCIELRNAVTDRLRSYSENYFTRFVLPRPGCGNGQRDWETEVKPIVSQILDHDRYIIISRPEMVNGVPVRYPLVQPNGRDR